MKINICQRKFLRFIKEHDDILHFVEKARRHLNAYHGSNYEKYNMIEYFFNRYDIEDIINWFYRNSQINVECKRYVLSRRYTISI